MKTIGFELSKRLTDLGLLDNIKTQYIIRSNGIIYKTYEFDILSKEIKQENGWGKTLTLEEAIEFLPGFIDVGEKYMYRYIIEYIIGENPYYIKYLNKEKKLCGFSGKTLLEAIEKMIEYLLDNGLLITKFK